MDRNKRKKEQDVSNESTRTDESQERTTTTTITSENEFGLPQSPSNINTEGTQFHDWLSTSISPQRSQSMSMTCTSFLSSHSNNKMTSIEKPMSPMRSRSMLESSHRMQGKSILVHNYLEQKRITIDFV